MSNPNACSDAEMAHCFTCGHRGIEHAHGTGACFSVKKWAAPCSCPAFVAVDFQHDPVQRVLAKIDQGAPISRDEMHHAVHEAAHRRTPVAHRSTEGVTPAEMMGWPEMQALADAIDPDCTCAHPLSRHTFAGCISQVEGQAGMDKGFCGCATFELPESDPTCPQCGVRCASPGLCFECQHALLHPGPDPIFDRASRPAPTREEIAAMAVHDALDIVSEPVRRPDGMLILEDDLRAVLRYLRVARRNLPDVTERTAP